MNFFKEHFEEDYVNSVSPNDRRMSIINELGINGMNTENIRFAINELVRKYAKTYLEVGSYHGSSLISAAKYNDGVRCIAIDNFSQFDPKGENKQILLNNIQKAEAKNIELLDDDYEMGITNLFKNEPDLKIDAYFYDGEHSYENQLNGLNIIVPHLSEKCIIFVDDTNYGRVTKANNEWLSNNRDFRNINISTPKNGHNTWWNGFTIMYRNLDL
jgi:predicted O-methyltransferase YrrM